MAIKVKEKYFKLKDFEKNENNAIQANFLIYNSEKDRKIEKNLPEDFYNFIKELEEKEKQLTKELQTSVSSRRNIEEIKPDEIENILEIEEKKALEYLEKIREDLRNIFKIIYSNKDVELNFLDEYLENGFKKEWLTPINIEGTIEIILSENTDLEAESIYKNAKKFFIDGEDC